MRIHYVCHACLLIETGDAKLATDPWFEGPAYCGQWHVFPRPVETQMLDQAQAIIISHAHEDHLHEPTLQRFSKGNRIFYPYYWYGDTIPYLRQMGFSEVIEVGSGKTLNLTQRTKLTFITVGQDSIMMIEAEGRAFANINDALHSAEPGTMERVAADLKKRWPNIDTVFCGFGGASYYPNTIHWQSKDDAEVARVREQLFLHNFCRIVQILKPAVAVPFAADFVLLDDRQEWINATRFPRERINDYYNKYFRAKDDAVKIHTMYPGDLLENNDLVKRSPYRSQIQQNEGLHHLIEKQYAEEIRTIKQRPQVPLSTCQDIVASLQQRLDKQSQKVDEHRLSRIKFSIQLTDSVKPFSLNVSFSGRRGYIVSANSSPPDTLFRIEAHSQILLGLFEHPWAGDVVIIGYGVEITVLDPVAISDGLLRTAMDLLSGYPRPADYMLHHPLRGLRYVMNNIGTAFERIRFKKAVQLHPIEKSLIKGSHWLTQPVHELRRICSLPVYPFRSSGD